MAVTKTKISVSISNMLAMFLEEQAKLENTSKSALVEKSLKQMIDDRMEKEAKIIAKTKFDDLPTEDEWLEIQSELPEW